MKEILYILLDNYAEHEIGFMSGAVSTDATGFRKEPQYINKMVAPTMEPVKSIGGMRTLPDYSFETMPADYAASASGYENSDVVTAMLCWIDADPKTEGIENGLAQVRANAVLIQSHDGMLSIAGVVDGTDIAVFSTSGQMVGSAKAYGTTSTVPTTLRSGNVAIVRIGDKSVKVVIQ